MDRPTPPGDEDQINKSLTAELSCRIYPLGGSLALCTIVLQLLAGRPLSAGQLETRKIANSSGAHTHTGQSSLVEGTYDPEPLPLSLRGCKVRVTVMQT